MVLAFPGACGGEDARRGDNSGATSQAEGTAGQAGGRDARRGGGATEAGETTAAEEEVALAASCAREGEERRIGSFERPEGVPPYETLVEEPADSRGCARAVRLLVDTRADSEAGYSLIARDIKARYADLDAVTVEFTDTSRAFSHNGSALIFNTPGGSYFMGYVYGPPNDDGYYVAVSE